MQQNELAETVLDAFAELVSLHTAAAVVAERAWSALAEHDGADFEGIYCNGCRYRQLPSNRPLIDTANVFVLPTLNDDV